MDKELAISEMPYGVILSAQSADGDINEFASDVEFEYSELNLTRVQLREILDYVATQSELDITAGTPTGTEALTRLIDDSMYREIKRLNREVRILTKIAAKPPEKLMRVKATGEQITPAQAQNRLIVAMSQLGGYSKLINDRKKAESGVGVVVNNNLDMRGLISEGLARVKTLDIPEGS